MFSGSLKFSDDEDLFGAAPSANNLGNIFGTGMRSQEENANVTLKYKSPKLGISNSDKNVGDSSDVSNNNSNQNRSVDWKILLAEVVFAYKLLNKENISQGKLALALLKSSDEFYKIILYRTKTDILSTTNLDTQKKLYGKNNYIQFEDDASEFWSVIFEKPANYGLILKELQDITTIEHDAKDQPKSEEVDGKIGDSDNKVENNTNNNTKENILSRMSKLGQPILLPKLPNSTTEMSDSSDSEVIPIAPAKPAVPSRKIHHHHNKSDSSTNLVPYNPSSQTMIPANSSFMMVAPSDSSSSLNIFLSENRTQNSEIRMNLLKMDTKIDRIIDRFDTLAGSTNKNMHHDDQIIELEEKILDLKKENRQMKILLGENNHKEKLIEVELLFKEAGLKNEELTSKIKAYSTELNDLKEEIKRNQTKLDEANNQYNELLAKFTGIQHESEMAIENYNRILTEKSIVAEKNTEQQNQINKLEDELNALKSSQSSEANATETIVKDIINNLYHKICDQFADRAEYSQNEAIKLIGRTIKQETNNQLKQLNKK